jgi:dolichol-phosphate mannosyltransferase
VSYGNSQRPFIFPILLLSYQEIGPTEVQRGPELSIVVPTFNESRNVEKLVAELTDALREFRWEVIFVDDDSADGTAAVVRTLGTSDSRVRCVQRIGRRGLSTACIEGMLASSAPLLAVMDGDLQHDPKVLPEMVRLLRTTEAEIVVASRYVDGGDIGEWPRGRATMSRLATRLSHIVVPTTLKDPMSGFFMLRRSLLDGVVRNLSGLGFKILLDIFASAKRPVAFKEIPFVFRARVSGESKLGSQAVWEYLMLVADKLVGRYVPVRFIVFATVGSLGVIVHLAIVGLTYSAGRLDFVMSQTAATVGAMVFNYSLNNAVTYRDRRRRGLRWLTGLLSFMAACAVGAIANVGVAAYLFQRESKWVIAAVAGILTGAVWNYAVTKMYTWGSPRRMGRAQRNPSMGAHRYDGFRLSPLPILQLLKRCRPLGALIQHRTKHQR